MIDTVVDWLKIFSAVLGGSLAAGGVAVLAIRFLGANIVGHWLAKALAKYIAEIETSEQRKRVMSERLDRERSETISKIMEQVAHTVQLMLYPPDLVGKETPEETFMLRYAEIVDSTRQVTNIAVKSSHRFGADEPLHPACFAWALEMISIAGAYYDALEFDEAHWKQKRAKRIEQLASIFETMAQQREIPAHQHLLEVCRQLYAPVGKLNE